ncbi:MAG: hypothetical protein Q7J72_07735 [Candidatus Omnitrophota bacterium]|nr:hypothetical protein [Candidatus Omnitrophota bacterium]
MLPRWITIIILFLFVSGCVSVNSNIIASSSDDNRYIDEVLSKLYFGMTKVEVAEVINQPYSNEIMRMSWHPPHAGNNSRIQAYFYKNKLFKISWLKMTGFMKLSVIYEKSAEELFLK